VAGLAAFADHPVAGDEEADAVGGQRAADGAKPWPISMPRPPDFISPGVIASQLTIRSCRRLVLLRPASVATERTSAAAIVL
jgi:hypothetical protein